MGISSYHWNRPAEMTLPGGSKRTLEYDPLMRIKKISAKDPGQNIIIDYQYTYDKMDNILGKSTEYGNYAYGYDDLYRLTSADNPDMRDEAFSYDPVGNRLTSAGISGNWIYNGNNELLGYDGVSYQYDENGNTTKKTDGTNVTSYVYNIEDRLVEVTTDNPQPATYKYYYDPFGRRLWKEVDGTRTYFMYSDEGLIAELDSSGNITKSYGYKPNSTWTTDPLFMKVSTDYYFYHNDHLDTSHKLTAINGSVVWSAKYSSFGEATIDPHSTITNNLRFPGQCYDQETGLHYNWHRYYDPKLGRYLTSDPIGLFFKNSLCYEINHLYPYVRNNPVNNYDNSGLFHIEYQPPTPPAWDVPPGVACNKYGSNTILRTICNSAGTGCWANCVRGCLLADWDENTCSYSSGLVQRHAECWHYCTIKCHGGIIVCHGHGPCPSFPAPR